MIAYTPSEFVFKMFKRKRCPKCGSGLTHYLKKEYIGVKFSIVTGCSNDTDQYFDMYCCQNCSIEYSLQDLMNYQGGNK
jgi:transcription initiation factor IIE alpha subunit